MDGIPKAICLPENIRSHTIFVSLQLVSLPHLVLIPTLRILRIGFTWNGQTPRRIGRSGSKVIRYPFLFFYSTNPIGTIYRVE
jgi:hypothetical protein